MNIVVTGSLGRISKPLAQHLLAQGHQITLVSHSENRRSDIEALGAEATIGSIADVPFLTDTFKGADVAYFMSPPDFSKADMIAYQADNGRDYAEAIRASGVKRVIFLSSFGAHRDNGVGIIIGKYHGEKALAELKEVSVTVLRPTSFYYNFNNYIGMIKQAGAIYTNYGGDTVIPMVAPEDIAVVAAEEINRNAEPGLDIRYIGSDERTGNEVAAILGQAIGKPDLKWVVVSNEQTQAGMEQAGLPTKLAADLTEMYAGLLNGNMSEDYYRHRPTLGKTKLEDFAPQFAQTYNAPDPAGH